jgi:RNA:NAD 2'-phosphotransferase (TPT1/KptA family)
MKPARDNWDEVFAALAKERWALRGHQIRAENGLGAHVATYQRSGAEGLLMAASPELLAMLLEACDTLDACERASSTHGTADAIRERLRDIWIKQRVSP